MTSHPTSQPIIESQFNSLADRPMPSTSKLHTVHESIAVDSTGAQQLGAMDSDMTTSSSGKTKTRLKWCIMARSAPQGIQQRRNPSMTTSSQERSILKRRAMPQSQGMTPHERQRRKSSMSTTTSKERALKTVKLIVLLSGAYLAMQFPPFIGRLIIALFFEPKSDANFGEISEEHMVGDISITTFIMRWMDIIYVGFYPCINPLILMMLDKESKLFRKYAAFCIKKNQVAVQ